MEIQAKKGRYFSSMLKFKSWRLKIIQRREGKILYFQNYKKGELNKIIFFGIFLVIVLSNSGGPGTFQRRDRTGSPLGVFSTCADCHFGGNFQGKLNLELLKDSVAVDYYQPGEEYLLKISFEASSNAKEFGFQAVAIMDSTYLNAGDFYNLPEFTQTVELLNRTYIEHSRPSEKKVFYFGWKAPDEVETDVLIYASGVATNNNNGTNGDQPLLLNAPLRISSSQINSARNHSLEVQIRILENPVVDQLKLEGTLGQNERVFLSIIDLAGKVIERYSLNWSGSIREEILVSNLRPGLYFMEIKTEKSAKVFSFLKI